MSCLCNYMRYDVRYMWGFFHTPHMPPALCLSAFQAHHVRLWGLVRSSVQSAQCHQAWWAPRKLVSVCRREARWSSSRWIRIVSRWYSKCMRCISSCPPRLRFCCRLMASILRLVLLAGFPFQGRPWQLPALASCNSEFCRFTGQCVAYKLPLACILDQHAPAKISIFFETRSFVSWFFFNIFWNGRTTARLDCVCEDTKKCANGGV